MSPKQHNPLSLGEHAPPHSSRPVTHWLSEQVFSKQANPPAQSLLSQQSPPSFQPVVQHVPSLDL